MCGVWRPSCSNLVPTGGFGWLLLGQLHLRNVQVPVTEEKVDSFGLEERKATTTKAVVKALNGDRAYYIELIVFRDRCERHLSNAAECNTPAKPKHWNTNKSTRAS